MRMIEEFAAGIVGIGDAFANIMAAFAVALSVAADRAPAPQPVQQQGPPFVVLSDFQKQCQYVVGITPEGLHVVINGAEHCRALMVDGARVELGKPI